jgi:hypothetical protein
MLQFVTGAEARPGYIFLPACGMAFWTFATLLRLILARWNALACRKVSLKYYKLYNQEGEPEEVAQLTQHVENLFEAPPLFYAAITALYVLRAVDSVSVGAAWMYLLLRIAHTLIHTGTNNVMHRIYAYFGSTVVLVFLWSLVARAALQLAE